MRSDTKGSGSLRSHSFGLAAVVAALTLAAIGMSDVAHGTRTVADDLTRAIDAYNRATVASDTAALAAIVTDDYMLVNSDATVQGKNSYLADFAVPGFKIEPYKLEQPFLRTDGGAALTGGTLELRWTQDGRRQIRRLRVSHFWLQQHGRWRLGYTQLTRVPD